MHKANSENFFYNIEWLSKLCGVWWPEENEKKIKKIGHILWNSALVLFALFYFICEVLKAKDAVSELGQFVGYIGMLFTHMIGLAKMVVLVVNQSKINELKSILQDKIYNYKSYGSFQPGKLFKESKNFCRKMLFLMFCMYCMVGWSAHVSALVTLHMNYQEQYFHNNVTCNDFILYFFKIPFPAPNKSSCKNAFIFMDVGLMIWAWYIVTYDGVFLTLLFCVKTKLHILYGAIKTIRERTLSEIDLPMEFETLRDEDFPELEEKLYVEICNCAKHLDSLLRVCEEIEKLFTYVTLGQMLASLLTIASCLFVTTQVSVIDPKFLSATEYMISILIQLSIICYCGNEITEASAAISYALFQCDWLRSSKRFKDCMVLMMIRVQRKVCLTIGKFSPLALTTLVSVVRGSFSYYALFKSVES